MNVSLPAALERFIASRVSSGGYQSASDVVRERLRLLQEREKDVAAVRREFRDRIAVALKQARAGKLIDGEEVFDKMLGRSTKRGSRRK